jgi:hypothetical protein
MQSFMDGKIGDPYTEQNPERFGPGQFDCSGLIWAAAQAAGIQMPGGPSDPAQAIVGPELQWLGSQPGATIITNPSQIQSGDIIGFVGADPAPGNIDVGGKTVRGMGHIGMAVSPTEYVSAYDTQEGVVDNPISGDSFVIAVRPEGGGGTPSSAPVSDSGGSASTCAGITLFGHCIGISIPNIGSDITDWLERGALIVMGAIIVLVGLYQMFKNTSAVEDVKHDTERAAEAGAVVAE